MREGRCWHEPDTCLFRRRQSSCTEMATKDSCCRATARFPRWLTVLTLQSPFAVEEGAYCFAALARKREENSLRHLRTRGGYGGGRVKGTRTQRYTLGFAHFLWNGLVKNSYACEICKASPVFLLCARCQAGNGNVW